MPPSIRYATARDGARIALTAIGAGTSDRAPLLCLPPFPFSHLEAGWRLDGHRRWYEGLAGGLEVALYDSRGSGLSDRERTEFSLEAMSHDLEAVAERLGWQRFALCGLFNSAPVAIAYAAQYPGRVTELVLWGGFASGADVYPLPLPAPDPQTVARYWPVIVETAARSWTSGDGTAGVAAYFGECVEPEAAIAAMAAARGYDVTALLPRVQARTLVLHRPHARGQRADLAQALAAAIPDAELALLDGDAPSPFDGDIEASVAAIQRFLGVPVPAAPSIEAGEGTAPDLTPRETEVLRLLARGLANKEIALALGLSIHTVERHLTNLYPKIGCRGRTEAAAYAITRGYA